MNASRLNARRGRHGRLKVRKIEGRTDAVTLTVGVVKAS